MDQKGSLVNTHLKIFPTESLLAFLNTLAEENDIPDNILKVIGKDAKETSDFTQDNIHFTSEDLENLKIIRESVKDKFNSKTVNEESPENDLKLVNEIDTKNADEGIEVDESADNVKTKDEIPKRTPFRTTSDLNWDEEEKPEEVKEIITEVIEEKPFLTTPDVDWLYKYLQSQKGNNTDVPYLHELLSGADVVVPDNKVIKRNPVLEARCVKLRKQQETREYRKMTKTVDNVRLKFPEDSIAYQMKQLNRQLIAIGQFILSILAGFLFGFRGVEWMVGNLDFGFRLLLGVMCSLVIALAEIYFLAKKLNEELNIPETVQLGGPPKFVDEDQYMNTVPTKKAIEKEHQD